MPLSQTLVKDSAGALLKVYRGEHGRHTDYIQTELPTISFGCRETATNYALNPNRPYHQVEVSRLISAYINITRPVFNDPFDSYIDYDDLVELVGIPQANLLFRRFAEVVMVTDAWQRMCDESQRKWPSVEELISSRLDLMSQLCIQIYPLLDDAEFIKLAISLGYNGAIHRGSGIGSASAEYRVFDESQIFILGVELL
jgi:hypothetical protein